MTAKKTRAPRPTAKKKTARKPARARMSTRAGKTSHATTVQPTISKSDEAAQIATPIKKSTAVNNRPTSTPYRSAISLLALYLKRGGRNVAASAKDIVEKAKGEFQRVFAREPSPPEGRATSHKATQSKRTVHHAAAS